MSSLEVEEADILCPPVIREETHDGSIADNLVAGDPNDLTYHPHPTLRIKSKFEVFEERLHAYIHKYAYDSAILNPGHTKPIPFDWLIFGWLDRYFVYPMSANVEPASPVTDIVPDPTTVRQADDVDEKAKALVLPHHKLVPWEDIPPYWRARGYDDQPAYTEGYDDFLWLPRDPLSVPDLDDTVEMRASLTTSAGGDGRFSGFDQEDEGEVTLHEEIGEGWKEIVANSSVSGSAARLSEDTARPPLFSSDVDATGMVDHIIPPSPDSVPADIGLPENIGSEVETTPLQSVRKGTIKFADGVQSIFRRPTAQTSHSEPHSMRSFSQVSTPSVVVPPATSDSPELILAEGGQTEMDEAFLTPHRPASRFHPPREQSIHEHDVETVNTPTQIPGSPTSRFFHPRSPTAGTTSGSGSRITFSSQRRADLGRSPSGRRPLLQHRSSQSSGTGGPSRLFSPVPPSATAPSIRSASALSHQLRDRSSSSLTAAQQALLREVMEEERVASQSAREAERAGLEKEREEVRKEREKAGGQPLPPATPSTGSTGPRRRDSISSSAAPSTANGDIRRSATTARAGGVGGAGMVALAAHKFAAGRGRRQTMSGHQSSPLSIVPPEDRRGSGSGAISGPTGSYGRREGGVVDSPVVGTPRKVIQAQLEQPRIAGGISGDTSGSSKTGVTGGVGLSGLGT
jgi:hypothetical protein